MQYHGIASYKFEYQLSTGGDWTTAVTTPSTATSYAYTIEGLTGGNSYNLRVKVADKAGNTGTGTNIATTKKPEKNPGGVINNITSEEIIYIGKTSPLITTNIGKTVEYDFTQKTVTFSENLSGGQTSYTGKVYSDWVCFAEDENFFGLISRGEKLKLVGVKGYNNRGTVCSTP